MQNPANQPDIQKFISALLTSRVSISQFVNRNPGLGLTTENTRKKAFLSAKVGLSRNSSRLLDQLSPNYAEDIKTQLSSGNRKNTFSMDQKMKEFISGFEKDPERQKALLKEVQRRAPFISQKLDRAIGKTSPAESLQVAENTMNREIKKCQTAVQARYERENRFLEDKHHRQGIQYTPREVEATVNGRGTGINVTVYQPYNLDQAHQSMRDHYTDMTNARINNFGTALNIGAITPAALFDHLVGQAASNNYDIASRIGATNLLKEHSVARFNKDPAAIEKITNEIKNKLTNYLNTVNGRTQEVGQSLNQNISQHQSIGIGM